MEDLYRIGGTPALMKYMASEGLLDDSQMTVTGKTIKENLSAVPDLTKGQTIIADVSAPRKATGHLQVRLHPTP